MTGPRLTSIVVDLIQQQYEAVEYGPFYCLIPSAYRRLLDQDYYCHPIADWRFTSVRQRINELEPIEAVIMPVIPYPHIVLQPLTADYVEDPELVMARSLLTDVREGGGLYRALSVDDDLPWLVLADWLEERGCPNVAAETRRQRQMVSKSSVDPRQDSKHGLIPRVIYE